MSWTWNTNPQAVLTAAPVESDAIINNVLSPDQAKAAFLAGDTSALYGGSWNGDPRRQSVSDYTVNFVRNALRQLYPNATEAQLNEAAWNSLHTNDPNAPALHYRVDDHKDITSEVLKRAGYQDAYGNYYGGGFEGRQDPTDIVRRIGYFMGGLPEGADPQLTQWYQQNSPTLLNMQNGVYQADKASNRAANMDFLKAVAIVGGMAYGLPALMGESTAGGLLGSGAIEGAAGVTEGLGASMAANGAAVANSTLAALPQAGFTIGEGLAAGGAAAGASGGFGQLAGSSVGEAFGAGAAPEMGSGLLGQSGALAQGAAGSGYVSPFATGSITGAGGMPSIGAGALGDIAATTGMSTAGLGAAGGALTAPVGDGFRTGINTWEDALQADAAEMAKPGVDWEKRLKDGKKLYDLGKGLMQQGQPQEQSGGLLDSGGPRQFSPLEVSYLPKLQSYGLLNQPQTGLLGF